MKKRIVNWNFLPFPPNWSYFFVEWSAYQKTIACGISSGSKAFRLLQYCPVAIGDPKTLGEHIVWKLPKQRRKKVIPEFCALMIPSRIIKEHVRIVGLFFPLLCVDFFTWIVNFMQNLKYNENPDIFQLGILLGIQEEKIKANRVEISLLLVGEYRKQPSRSRRNHFFSVKVEPKGNICFNRKGRKKKFIRKNAQSFLFITMIDLY